MKIIYTILLSFILATVPAIAGIMHIDTFTVDQGPLVAEVGETIESSVQGDSILGGERDLTVTTHSSIVRGFDADIAVSNGIFAFNADAGVDASFTLVWDGVDNSSAVDVNGLADNYGNGIDFTNGGLNNSFLTDIVFSDTGFWWSVEVWWADGTQSELLEVAGIESDYNGEGQYDSYLRFEYFEDADWSDVSALAIEGNILAPLGEDNAGERVTAFDVMLDDTVTAAIPEPSPAPLMAMGLCLLMGSGCIHRRKVKGRIRKPYS